MSADTSPPERVTLTDEERERLSGHLTIRRTEGPAAREMKAALFDAVERILAAREQALREEERAAWSGWLDGWIGAVTPTPPTIEAVADALRSGPRPFGVARGGAR